MTNQAHAIRIYRKYCRYYTIVYNKNLTVFLS